MTSIAALDSSRLSVLLDLRHPLAYLALHPTAALANEFGIEINWLPIETPPLRPPSVPGPDDDRGIRHRRYRAQAIAREIEIYSAVQELVLLEAYRDADPRAVNLAWIWLRERHPQLLLPFLSEAFRSYWALELDASDRAAVATLVESIEGDGSEFLVWSADNCPATQLQHHLADEVRKRGLSGTPCYVIDNEVFLGRQHLPMIRWILDGRSGPVPI